MNLVMLRDPSKILVFSENKKLYSIKEKTFYFTFTFCVYNDLSEWQSSSSYVHNTFKYVLLRNVYITWDYILKIDHP